MRTTIFISLILFLTSCQTRYIVNEQGGIRPKGKMFSYENKTTSLKDNLLIDTTSIYIRKGQKITYGTNVVSLPTVYYRFWENGRVQEVYPKELDINNIINNTEIGYIGYYYIKKGRLKMQLIETLNGGQTGKRYGLFDNGNIWFYEQRPETYYGSWNMLKWLENNRKTEWIKISIDSLKHINPTW